MSIRHKKNNILRYIEGGNRVIFSTWSPSGYILNNFRIVVLDPSHGVFSMLCEKGNKNNLH